MKIIAALLGVALLYTLYLYNQLSKRDLEIGKSLADQTDKVAKLEVELQRVRGRNQAEIDEDKGLAYQLQGAINQKKNEIADLDAQISRLRNGEGRDVESSSAKDAYDAQNAVVTDLGHRLESVRSQRQQFKNSMGGGGDQARQAHAADDAGMTDQIRAQTAQLQSLQAQMKDLKSRIGDFDAKAQIPQVNQQIVTTKGTIDQLKAQKKSLDEQWNAQQSDSRSVNGSRLAQLKNQEDSLALQYQEEKARLSSLERDWKSLQGTRQQEKGQIQSVVASRDQRKAELADLQNQLAGIQKKLSDLGVSLSQ